MSLKPLGAVSAASGHERLFLICGGSGSPTSAALPACLPAFRSASLAELIRRSPEIPICARIWGNRSCPRRGQSSGSRASFGGGISARCCAGVGAAKKLKVCACSLYFPIFLAFFFFAAVSALCSLFPTSRDLANAVLHNRCQCGVFVDRGISTTSSSPSFLPRPPPTIASLPNN